MEGCLLSDSSKAEPSGTTGFGLFIEGWSLSDRSKAGTLVTTVFS